MKQDTALKLCKAGKNIFLTGSAGTGKTFLIQQYIDYLKNSGVFFAVIAPTGVAASHLNGNTIHSFFGLGPRENIDDYYLDSLLQRKYLHDRFRKLKVLIIDEISMVSPELFSAMDRILKAFKFSAEPFGGVQVIVSGDFFQLPPVSKKQKEKKFCWQHYIWKDLDFITCYLDKKFRQKKKDKLVKVLDEIREGCVSKDSLNFLLDSQKRELDIKVRPTKLYTHNVDVDALNKKYLSELDGQSKVFLAIAKGAKKYIDKLYKSSLLQEKLELKIGAIVMFIKNNPEKGYINGTIGEVIGFNEVGMPIVETFSGKKITAEYDLWELENDDEKTLASISQVPLRLAWAMTVHKSQGMSLDTAEIDLSKTFEDGQGYVALSRVRSEHGLKVKGFNEKSLKVDSLILFVDKRMKESSQKTELELEGVSQKQWGQMFDIFLKKVGGKKKVGKKNKEKNEKSTQLNSQRIQSHLITKELFEKTFSIKKVAKGRNLSEDTVLKHLIKIKNEHLDFDLSALKPEKKILNKVKKAVEKLIKNKENFNENGSLKLKVLYDELDGEISYTDIKLSLLFID